MVGHGGSSAGSYLADPTSPIPSHCASIVSTSTLRVKILIYMDIFTFTCRTSALYSHTLFSVHSKCMFLQTISVVYQLMCLSYDYISLSTACTQLLKENFSVLGNQCVAHSTKKPVTTMLTYPWKCTGLHCNHLGNTWKPLVLMTRHFDYCPSARVIIKVSGHQHQWFPGVSQVVTM